MVTGYSMPTLVASETQQSRKLHLNFAEARIKISVLTETHIGQEQFHQIRNNWLGRIFFAPGDTFSKGILIFLHPGFEMSQMLTQIQMGDLCPSKLLPLMTEFSVSMLLQVIVAENNWLGYASLKVYKII